MATIASLAVMLTANTANFNREFRASEQVNERFNRTLQEGERQLQRVETAGKRASLVLAGLTAAWTLNMRASMRHADTVDKASQRVGVAAREYQAMQYALGQLGVAESEAERAMGRLNQRIGLAEMGSSKYSSALRMLEVDIRNIEGAMRSTDDIMREVLHSLSLVEDSQLQSALASEVFGTRLARQLMPAIRAGADAIDDQFNQALTRGIVNSNATVGALVMLGDEVMLTQSRVGGLSREWMAGYVPATLVVMDRINRMIDVFFELDAEQRQQIIRWSAYAAGVLAAGAGLGIAARVMVQSMRIMRTFGMVSSLVFSPLVLKGALVAGAVWLVWEAWKALGDIRRPNIRLPEVDLPTWEQMWSAIQEVPDKALAAAKRVVEDFKWPSLPGLPKLTGGQETEEEVEGVFTRIAATVRNFKWPNIEPAPTVDIEPLEQGETETVTLLASLQTRVEGFTWPTLPSAPTPDMEGLSEADSEVDGLLTRLMGRFEGVKWEPLPDVPTVDTSPLIEADEEVDSLLGSLRSRVSGFEWPAIPELRWPEVEPPTVLQRHIETVRRGLEELSATGRNLTPPNWDGFEPPDEITAKFEATIAGQAYVTLRDLHTEWQQGEAELEEVLRRAWTAEVGTTLGAIAVSMLPIPWWVKLPAIAITLLPVSIEDLTWENIRSWAVETWDNVVQSVTEFLRRPRATGTAAVVMDLAGEYSELDAALGDVDLAEFMLRLGMTESGLQNVANGASTATGEFQLLAETRRQLENALGAIDWEDDTERMRAAFEWLRLGVENEGRTIERAADRLGISMEEALHLWWVRGGPGLREMQSLDDIATMGVSAAEILKRRMEFELPAGLDLPPITLESLPLEILAFEIPRDPIEAGEEIAHTIGYWIGLATPAIVASVGAVGYVLGRDVVIPIGNEFVKGFLEGLADFFAATTGSEVAEEISNWLSDLESDSWELTLMTVGVTLGSLVLWKQGAALAAWLGAQVGAALSGALVPLVIGVSAQIIIESLIPGNVAELRDQLQEIIDGEAPWHVKIPELTLEVARTIFRGLPEIPDESMSTNEVLRRAWWALLPTWLRPTGYQSGTPWTGWGPTDEVAGVVHRREAVIPWTALRGGIPGVLEFLGAPGFQDGRLPGDAPWLIDGQVMVGGVPGAVQADQVGLLRRIIDQMRGFGAGLGPDWEARIETVINVLEGMASAVEWGQNAIVSSTDFLRELNQALSMTPEELMAAADSGDTLARKLLGLGDDVEDEADRLRRTQDRWQSGIDGFILGLDTGSQALDRFASEALRSALVPGVGTEGLLQFGLNLAGQLIGGILSGPLQGVPEPRDFDAFRSDFQYVDPAQSGVLATQEAMAQAQRELASAEKSAAKLESELDRLNRRLAQQKQHMQRMDNAWDRLFGAYDTAAAAVSKTEAEIRNAERAMFDTQREAERLRRELGQMDDAIPRTLGIDAQTIGRAVEAGLASADPSRISGNLEDTVRAALIRAWITAEAQLERMDMFEGLVMGAVQQFLETGSIIEEDLAPIRGLISEIETEAEAFNAILEALGLTVERTDRSLGSLSRNLPTGLKVAAMRFDAASPMEGARPLSSLAEVGPYASATVAPIGPSERSAASSAGGDQFIFRNEGTIIGVDELDEYVERSMERAARRKGLLETGNVSGKEW